MRQESNEGRSDSAPAAPKPKPIVANEAACRAAVEAFIAEAGKGCDGDAQFYRNLAYALGLLQPEIRKIADKVRAARKARHTEKKNGGQA